MNKCIYPISTLDEFQDALAKVKARYPDLKFVYRGQEANHRLVPNIKRRILDDRLATAFPIINAVWERFVQSILMELGVTSVSNLPNYIIAGMALLQHYGFRSWFIDVSHDSLVALWFAVNRYSDETVILKPRSCFKEEGQKSEFLLDHACAVTRKAKYERVHDGRGFFYILGISLKDADLLLDLRNVLPHETAPRIHRQTASGVLEPSDGRTIDSMVLAKFEIAGSIEDIPSLSFESLFPPPRIDRAYRLFLSAPYLVRTHDVIQHKLFGHPILDVPIYAYNESALLEVLSLVHIVLGDEIFFHWGDLYSETSDTQEARQLFRGKTEKFLEAISVQLPISLPGGPKSMFSPDDIIESAESEEATITRNDYEMWLSALLQSGPVSENVWPSQNIFLEESVFAVTGGRLSKGIDEILRGYWVLWSPEGIYLCQIVDEFYYISSKLGCHFRLMEGRFRLCRDPGDCQLDDDDVHIAQLALFLVWTKSLKEGKAKLTKVEDGIFHFYWQ